jgi:hypothetical protein
MESMGIPREFMGIPMESMGIPLDGAMGWGRCHEPFRNGNQHLRRQGRVHDHLAEPALHTM